MSDRVWLAVVDIVFRLEIAMNVWPVLRLLLAAALLLFSLTATAINLVPVLSGISNPVFVTHADDGSHRLFIVERRGVILVMQPGAAGATTFLDVRSLVTDDGSEQGLLGLAFHPLYEANGRFFVFYTRIADGALVVAEFRVSADPNVAGTAQTVHLTIPHPNHSNHNGGMLAFGPDGYLYIGTGDGGSANDPSNNAQNLNVLLGKILRIDVDRPDTVAGTPYSSPPDNPFVGIAGLDEIFAYGMRNPWRFSFDRMTDRMWVADVGQGTREEVNSPIVKGGNYGWRVYEGSVCTNLNPSLCNPVNYLFPVHEYGHGGGRCSITGGYVFRGASAALSQGAYVFADFCTGEIFAFQGGNASLLLDTSLNVSSFGEDEAGELYVVGLGGSVHRIAADASQPTITSPPAGSVLPGSTVTFSWSANGWPVTEWWLYVGSSVGAHDYHDSGSLGTQLSTTVAGLPSNGSTVYVRLWFRIAGVWQSTDFQYTAAREPAIVNPAPGSVLPGSSATFAWTANGAAVAEWWLYAGSTAGGRDYHDSGSLGASLSASVAGLPTDGSLVYVRLWFRVTGVWQFADFQYTAATAAGMPAITSPAAGSVLSATTVTFNWTPNGAAVSEWWIYAGASPGAREFFDSGSLGSALSTTIGGLPADGSTLFVRLWYRVAGAWQWRDFQYTATPGGPRITSPAPGSTLPDTSVSFSWIAGPVPVTEWWLHAGSSFGAMNYHDSGSLGTSTSAVVTGLPSDGSSVFVRLWFRTAGSWRWNDFLYNAVTQ